MWTQFCQWYVSRKRVWDSRRELKCRCVPFLVTSSSFLELRQLAWAVRWKLWGEGKAVAKEKEPGAQQLNVAAPPVQGCLCLYFFYMRDRLLPCLSFVILCFLSCGVKPIPNWYILKIQKCVCMFWWIRQV